MISKEIEKSIQDEIQLISSIEISSDKILANAVETAVKISKMNMFWQHGEIVYRVPPNGDPYQRSRHAIYAPLTIRWSAKHGKWVEPDKFYPGIDVVCREEGEDEIILTGMKRLVLGGLLENGVIPEKIISLPREFIRVDLSKITGVRQELICYPDELREVFYRKEIIKEVN
jgi:hypothetical protein